MNDDPLGIGRQQRGKQYRQNLDAESEQRAMAHGGLEALMQTRGNNIRSAAMSSAISPQWDGFFQALRESGGGKEVRLAQARTPTATMPTRTPPASPSMAALGVTAPRPSPAVLPRTAQPSLAALSGRQDPSLLGDDGDEMTDGIAPSASAAPLPASMSPLMAASTRAAATRPRTSRQRGGR